jgi:hypothetical protein
VVLHRTEQVVTNLKVPTGIRNTDFYALVRVTLCLLDFTDTYCSVVSGGIITADTTFTVRKRSVAVSSERKENERR